MSVSALDLLLLSVAGKPSPFTGEAAPGSVPLHQRFLFQSKPRKRGHAKQQQPLALRLQGLKKSGLPRTLLAAFRVDVDGDAINTSPAVPMAILDPPRPVRLTDTGLFSESKVRLFFEGLVLPGGDSTRRRLPWQLPTPLKLLGWSDETTNRRPHSTVYDPSEGLLVGEQIEHVRWQRRGSKSRRRASPSSRVRRCSAVFEPRESVLRCSTRTNALEARELLRTQSAAELDRVEAAIDAATVEALRVVAAEANAQLSFELLECKSSNSAQYIATTGVSAAQYEPLEVDTESVQDWQTLDSTSATKQDTTESHTSLTDEVKALQAENAEQKALIRQLLLENRRLVAQQQQRQPPPPRILEERQIPVRQRNNSSQPSSSVALEKKEEQLRDRGVSNVSTTSSSTLSLSLSLSLSRRASLSFDVVDGEETFVDHKFDHLVSEITSEIAELLSKDGLVATSSHCCGNQQLTPTAVWA